MGHCSKAMWSSFAKDFNTKINYSIARAEKQSEFGKNNPLRLLMPNLGEQGRQAIASTAGDPSAEEARCNVEATRGSGSANPSAKASSSGDAQRSKKQKR